jgi:hypothetical protein
MRLKRILTSASFLALLSASLIVVPAGATSAAGTRLGVQLVGHTSLRAGDIDTEIRPEADSDTVVTKPGRRVGINRRLEETPPQSAGGPAVAGSPVAPTASALGSSWEGLNHFDTRFAVAGGNQFSTEPPDQGLCAGNGYVFESVNSVVAVYTSGGALLNKTAINAFYGYPYAYDRTTATVGPDVFDPTCYYDPATQRWFQVANTLAVDSSGNFTGKSTIDIAVSATSSPIGSWNIYRVAAQNDGTDGTPNHHCEAGPCFPDYPHIGADANGFYVTINEYAFFADAFYGVDIYSFSKSQMAAGAASPNGYLTSIDGNAENAFTVWPAQSPGTNSYATGAGGTEYFLSSDAVFNGNGRSSQIFLWALTNTSSLNGSPLPVLHKATVPVNQYSVPDAAVQKAGNAPLRDCINDTSLIIQGLGSGCWRFFFAAQAQPAHNEVLGPIDANDSRMQQVSYANGKVWGALDTGVTSPSRAGIAWYAINPNISPAGTLTGSVAGQGTLAAAGGNSLAYPALAMTGSGKGVIGFTLVGPDWFPSAAYVTLTQQGTGSIQVARAGNDSQDGFSEYRAFPPFRPRWGDYGAAATDGNSIWIASEYIEASCTYSQWLATNFRCGDTRTALGNWSTRISKVNP